MRLLRNLTTAPIFIGIVAIAVLSSGCEYARKIIAKDKLNQGAILYNQGKIREAREFFTEATNIDKDNATAWLYLGATLVRDYKEEENVDKQKQMANDALKVYETALSLSANNCTNKDNAISYIAVIYDDLKKKDEWRIWMLKRAEDECSNKQVRAVSYYSVAQDYWDCAYTQTTRYQDKTNLKDAWHYRNMDYSPAAQADKKMTEECVTKGLEYIEKALKEDPEYVEAMYYQGLLYRERQKLTKEESKRRELDKLALSIADKANALQKKKQAEEQQKQGTPQG